MNRFILLLLLLSLALCGCIAYNSTSVIQKTLSAADCPPANQNTNIPPPHVDPALPGYTGDMVYRSGHVIDGKANVYLIFWIDGTFQPASPLFVSLTEQFVQDAGKSPFYANLSQYHDAQNRRPECAVLAGTFIDTRPFPANLVAAWKQGVGKTNQTDPLSDTIWRSEIAGVAQQQRWDTKDYHNIFVILPTIRWGACGYHNFLKNGNQVGSPWAYISFPFDKSTGQESCADAPQSPNNDPTADITIDTLSHELAEAVSDPFLGQWTSNGFEMADKCQLIAPETINPRTHGNVTWQGHTYIIQEEYDNLRHGCVAEGL